MTRQRRPFEWLLLIGILVLGEPRASAQEASWGDLERRAYVFQAAQRGTLERVAFGADGSHVAIATGAGYLSLIDAHAGVVLATRRIDLTSALYVAGLQIEPHGRWVLLNASSDSAGGSCTRWEPASDRTRAVPIEDLGSYDLVFSPDGTRLVTTRDESLMIARASDGRELVEAPHGNATLFWPDRRAIVAFESGAHTLEILDSARLTVRATLHEAIAIAFDLPHHRVYARTPTAIVGMDLRTGRETSRVARPLEASATSPRIVVSSDGRTVAIADVPASSTFVTLDGRAEDRTLPGEVLWSSGTRAIIRAVDGTVGRHLIATGGRSSWVSRNPIEASALFIGPDGTAVFERAGQIQMSSPDGTRSAISMEGEHSVWWASADAAHVAIGGRFGFDLWEAAGVRALASCDGEETHRFDAGGALVAGERQCDLATGRPRPYVSERPQVSDSGVVTGTDRGRVQLRGARRVCDDDGEVGGACDPDLVIEARGRYVVMTQPGDFSGDRGESRVYEVLSGRQAVTLPWGDEVVVDPLGRWAAALSAEHVSLVSLPRGEELMHLGAPVDEDASSTSTAYAVSGDGSRLAIAYRGSVRVLDATTGRVVQTIAAPHVDDIVLSEDGTTIAIRASDGGARSGLVTAPLTAMPVLTGLLSGVFCAGGHAYTLVRTGPGLSRRDLGACLPGATLTSDGQYLVATSEGVVRVRRVSTGSELTFRSIRGERYTADGERLARTTVIHFAHDAAGHYWTDAVSGAPVRVRDAAGALVPLDPALSDPQLLTRFFGGTS